MEIEISERLQHILKYLLEGKKKMVEEDDGYKITAYWVGKIIRIDISIKEG